MEKPLRAGERKSESCRSAFQITGVPDAPGFGVVGWRSPGVPDAPGFGVAGWRSPDLGDQRAILLVPRPHSLPGLGKCARLVQHLARCRAVRSLRLFLEILLQLRHFT